jgi:hypothetical protein
MEFSDFSAVISQWCEQNSPAPLDCWIDEANARLVVIEGGVRCSIDILDPYDARDPLRVAAMLSQGGASVACDCDGALGIDPDTHCLTLLNWRPGPGSPEALMDRLEGLANQRAAMLSLLETYLRDSAVSVPRRGTNNAWQPGV